MSKTIHRQITRLGTRSADDASVAMIIKEADDMDVFLGKLVQHTKTWRDSWTDILVTETGIADSFHDVYQTIPRTGDSTCPPEDTPQEIIRRVALLHSSHNELKNDMLEEVAKVEKLLIVPMTDCRAVLKPVKKAIEKRDHKKLDFERFNKAVESSKAKKDKSDREYSVQSKNEAELERATLAYEIADDYLRDYIPPILAKIVEFIPLIVEIAAQVQFTLLQHSYSALFHYATENEFIDPDGEIVVAEWEELFLPVKQQVESGLRLIAKGKAVTMPMNYIYEKTILPKLSSNPLARGKKPPPPPPPMATDAADGAHPLPFRGRENSRPGIGKQMSSASLSSRFSRTESSPPPPVSIRPSIGGIKARSRSSAPAIERDESPPLPGPRPRTAASSEYNSSRIGSYGSGMGGDSATPTPLAGLKPSLLRPGNVSPAAGASPPAGRIGRSLSPSRPPASARSPSQNSLASVVVGKKKPPPPPPKKKFAGNKEIWVKAIFTFDGQDRGDLSFNEGDKIKVLKKTDSLDDWWEGEVNGRKGQFPANYCEPTA